jgi:hypothetical protein
MRRAWGRWFPQSSSKAMPMNKFLACTLVAAIMGVVLWWQLGAPQSEKLAQNAAAPLTQEASSLATAPIERMRIADEAMEAGESSQPLWDYTPELVDRFRQAYAKSEAVLEAEAESWAYIKKLTLERKDQGRWQRISEAMELLEQSGMAVSSFSSSTFQDVLIYAYHPIANKLGRQLKEYRQWETDPESDDYWNQRSRLQDYPLDFAPEQHFLSFQGYPVVLSVSAEALREAAEFRDKILLLHGEQIQARSVMEDGILAVAAELGISVPHHQNEQAIAELLPAYAAHLQAEEELGTRYAAGLLAILAGHDGL